MFVNRCLTSEDLNLHTDTCGFACAAVFNSQWFTVNFPQQWRSFNIALSELYPIVLALHIWGINMANKYITFHCDNKAVTYVINKQSSKELYVYNTVLLLNVSISRAN